MTGVINWFGRKYVLSLRRDKRRKMLLTVAKGDTIPDDAWFHGLPYVPASAEMAITTKFKAWCSGGGGMVRSDLLTILCP
ncbi:hypothetical protein GR212_28620 [Rhizobium lusitanum]|uniref:Uncharacterized protein n=1 Tax=Rhizobium lusitanum TaxID=293958 RepID=A0A6L9UC62_9HYPH|nr:hypothetical protein [Rhizobium lusitanum]NEI73523.1 hypothetical protein [Rhizobium lusitanum]